MRTHVVNIGKSIYGGECNSEELSQYELEGVECQGIDEIWYHYNCGGYEGWGHLLARIEDRYELFDLGHCSCYGPTDGIGKFEGDSLSALFGRCSKELQGEVVELFRRAGLQQ